MTTHTHSTECEYTLSECRERQSMTPYFRSSCPRNTEGNTITMSTIKNTPQLSVADTFGLKNIRNVRIFANGDVSFEHHVCRRWVRKFRAATK